MDKKILGLGLLFFVLLVILMPVTCSAAGELLKIVNTLKTSLTALGTGLATIAFIVAGVTYLASTANPSLMSVAKGSLIAAIVGITIILLAGTAEVFVKGLTGL